MTTPDFQLSKEVGASFERDESVTLFDTRGYSPVKTLVLTKKEMLGLTVSYFEGRCKLCFCETPANDVLCCDCAKSVYEQHKLNCLCEI